MSDPSNLRLLGEYSIGLVLMAVEAGLIYLTAVPWWTTITARRTKGAPA